tara:strand:- start:194 stop:925 length:732 start_codon:yes stop_codon:yes gene_type:complete
MEPRNPIRELIPGLSLDLVKSGSNTITFEADSVFGLDGSNGRWTQHGTPALDLGLFEFQGYTDITGLVRGEQTLFPVSWSANPWLHPKIAYYGTGDAANKAYEVDIVWYTTTSEPDEVDAAAAAGPAYWDDYVMGTQFSLVNAQTFTELVGYGWSSFSTEGQLTTSATVKTGSSSFGYLTPTASTRLHHRCFVAVKNWRGDTTGAIDKVEIYPSVITIGQEIDRESDLEYIMRLQRLAVRDPA